MTIKLEINSLPRQEKITFIDKELKRKKNSKGLSLCGDFGNNTDIRIKKILKRDIAYKIRDCACSDSDDNPWS